MTPKKAAAHRKKAASLVDRHGRRFRGEKNFKRRTDALPEHVDPWGVHSNRETQAVPRRRAAKPAEREEPGKEK
ncbi:hypothetical protein HY631_04330 [Candidatus Uhrbacteria bacterium]|nr:hypothetical protein [Candidatus Uhrbacteria bacterium]